MAEREETKKFLIAGIILGSVELVLFLLILFIHSARALKILSMIAACHIGGRLAFIGTGLEVGFGAIPVMAIVLIHNTSVVVLIYSIFVLLPEKISKFNFISALHQKVQQSKRIRSRWNLLGIAVFTWIPLPMTGAVVGSLLAYFQGYDSRRTMAVTLPAMWVGVVSWTALFDRVYVLLRSLHSGATIALTCVLLAGPVIYNLVRRYGSND